MLVYFISTGFQVRMNMQSIKRMMDAEYLNEKLRNIQFSFIKKKLLDVFI